MQELGETLKNRVLPSIRRRVGRVIAPVASPPGAGTLDESPHSIEVYNPEHHDYFEAMWLLSGQAHMKINECVYTFEMGDLCFLPPLFSHADVYNRETPAYESLWFSYESTVLSINFFRYKPFGQSEALAYGGICGWPEIASTFLALYREATDQDAYNEDATHALLLQLVILLLRALDRAAEAGTPSLFHGRIAPSVQRYLKEHFADDVTLAEVAGVLRLSPNYVSSVFKQETGQPIFDALMHIRIEHAARLLLEEAMPIHAVAKTVGYHSTEHFSRVFRRIKGMPPSRYGKIKVP